MGGAWRVIGAFGKPLGLGILVLAVTQCAPLKPFHTEPGLSVAGHAEKYPTEVTDLGPEFSLAMIEFDDQGELWNSNQLSFVVDEIEKESSEGPLMLILFTHGWNNSARPSTKNNLGDFKKVLAGLARTFHTPADGQPARRVFGVYLGWRGRSVRGLTVVGDFWSRMSAAHRVGGGAAVTESVYSVTHSARRANSKNKVIVIGHSFGGIVMENAMSKGLAAQVGASPGDGAPLDFGADLVMLINPAERSTYTRQLVTTFNHRDVKYDRRGPGGTRVPMPMVVSLTSESDLATGWAFPVGVGVGRVLGTSVVSGQLRRKKGPRSYNDPALEGSQRYALHRTPGHNPYLWSHETSLLDYAPGDAAPVLSTELWAQNRHPLYDPADGSLTFRTTQGRLVLQPQHGFNQSPYWIFRVDRKIVEGHNKIWTKNVMAMAVSLANMKEGLELPGGGSLGPDKSAKPRVME